MNEIVKIFGKLSENMKYKFTVIILGLLMPSLIVLILIYPVLFEELDIFKMVISVITINFVIMFCYTSMMFVTKVMIYWYRKKHIEITRNKIYNKYNKLTKVSKKLIEEVELLKTEEKYYQNIKDIEEKIAIIEYDFKEL